MCKPVIAQDGYDNGLILLCEEHKTREPVLEDGHQVYQIDVLTHIDMLIAHRAQYDKPKQTWEEWAKSLSDKTLKCQYTGQPVTTCICLDHDPDGAHYRARFKTNGESL